MASPTFTVECRAGTLELREALPSDVTREYVDWMNDPEVVQYTMQKDKLHSMESVTRYVEEISGREDVHFFGFFHEGRHIGNIKLGPIDKQDGSADISYIIGRKDYWNKGVASAAVKAVSDFGLGEIGLGKIHAYVVEENVASVKALEKAGFEVAERYSEECVPGGECVDQVKLARKAD